jgi:cytidine deaminase
MEKEQILKILSDTKERALATYSNFKVAAIIFTATGRYYTGHNIESSSYGLTICAERVAIFKALSEGERVFKKICILSDGNEFPAPCGACRQVLSDFAPAIQVFLYTEAGKEKSFNISELLPLPFRFNK